MTNSKLVLLFVVLVHCSRCTEPTGSTVTESGDTIITEDSINRNAALIIKRIEGVVVDSFTVVNGSISGLRKKLSADEGYMIWNYVDGIQDGPVEFFYKNNTLLYSGHLHDTVQVRDWNYYYQNGEIKAYNYFDPYGRLSFTRKYDSLGNAHLTQGSVIVSARYAFDTIHVGGSFQGSVEVATPPHSTVSLVLCDITTIGDKEVRNNFDTLRVKDNRAEMNKKIERQGMNTIGLLWKLTDEKGAADSGYQIIHIFGSESR